MESAVRTFVRRTGAIEMSDVTLDLVQGFFYEGREKHQWGFWCFSNYHKYLKKFFGWCVSQGHMAENPLLAIGLPARPQKLPRRLSFEEAQRILYSAFNITWQYEFERTRNHAIIAMLLYTGLRAQELLNLEVTDLDLRSGSLLVRRGKGAKDRYVPLHFKLRYVLKRYLGDRQRLRKESPFLFTGVRSGKPLGYKDLRRVCRRVSKETHVSFTPHQLRHTFASVSIDQGMGLTQVKEILGHSNIASTMIYVRLSTRSLRDGLNKIDLF
ncbi:MAG: tyrosine-type recombinase/integrase [Deltaproteobacteria bacterium]|nr:tyrosine-type recombinase/integrase [Deltaproteobacteria bacterium]